MGVYVTHFKKAKMIFLKGKRFEKNIQAGFRKDFSLKKKPKSIVLRITGRTFYKIYINGDFVFYGPARAPHEYSKVNIINIKNFVKIGINKLAIEIAGYNYGNLYVTGEYSFLIAEVESDGDVILYTDEKWKGLELKQKRRYAENYSHARCISEIYDLDDEYYRWRSTAECDVGNIPVEIIHDNVNFLDRGVGIPDYQIVKYAKILNISNVILAPDEEIISNSDYPMMPKTPLVIQEKGSIERPVVDCKNDRDVPFSGEIKFGLISGLSNAQEIYVRTENDTTALDFDFTEMASAFPGIEFSCPDRVTIDLIPVDKLTEDGGFNPNNCHSITVIRLHCKAGRYRFESFEPYSVRYIRVIFRGAKNFILHDVFIRRCQYPDLKGGGFLCSDNDLNRIYEAARVNLRLNTFDNFMDCPGRERGGWAMDSFWTARAARLLFGDTKVERAHLQNFLTDSVNKYFPDFMPACYPAEEGVNIPTWTIFLGLELYEYYRRTADREFLIARAEQVERMIGTLSKYENKHGLLENLPNIYVGTTTSIDEPSANDIYNMPISTATNALYAVMLKCLGEIYNREEWITKAGKILSIIKKVCVIQESDELCHFVPDAFTMNENGEIIRGKYSSESTQYILMWLGILNRDNLPGMFKIMFEEFGPNPVIPFSDNKRFILGTDLLVGTYIRFEVLHKYGEYGKLLREMKRLFTYMIDNGPGTLWEGWGRYSNINHGYASHAAVWLFKSFLGLNIPDEVEKTIDIAPHPCGLHWAKGYTIVNSSIVSVSWKNETKKFEMLVSVPDGYRVNLTIPEEIYGWNIYLKYIDSGEKKNIEWFQKHITDLKKSFILTAVKP